MAITRQVRPTLATITPHAEDSDEAEVEIPEVEFQRWKTTRTRQQMSYLWLSGALLQELSLKKVNTQNSK